MPALVAQPGAAIGRRNLRAQARAGRSVSMNRNAYSRTASQISPLPIPLLIRSSRASSGSIADSARPSTRRMARSIAPWRLPHTLALRSAPAVP